MPTLRVKQNGIEYYGFYAEPVFDLMGDLGAIVKLFYNAFKSYGVNLASFRGEGDNQDLASTAVFVRIPSLGSFRFKFEQIQAISLDFNDEQLGTFFEMLQRADEQLRGRLPTLTFRSHMFVYTGHFELLAGTATEFLRGLPNRDIPVPGEDLGSGISFNWKDPALDAKVALSIDHSLLIPDGLFVNYRVVLDRDRLDYIPLAVTAQQLLFGTLASVGLEIESTNK